MQPISNEVAADSHRRVGGAAVDAQIRAIDVAAWRLARNATSAPTSSTRPARALGFGMNSATARRSSSTSSPFQPRFAARRRKLSRTSSVAMIPGLTVFTVMPLPASSFASPTVRFGSAAFAA